MHSSSAPNPPSVVSSSSAQKVKRKRLAKACDACHKSKRRCDGTSPCANCEFAAKVCVYTDASGQHIPPPLERSSIASASPYIDGLSLDSNPVEHKRRKPSQVTPLATDQQRPPFHRSSGLDSESDPSSAFPPSASSDARSNEPLAAAPPQDIGIDSVVAHELVNLFFFHLHPYNLAFHRPTFLSDLSAGRVPSYLLCAVLALAAPLSSHPSVQTNPPHCAGERFALTAKKMMLDSGGGLKVKPCLEVAQALTLITMHDCIGRQTGRRTDYYQHIALDVLIEGGVRSFDATPSTPGEVSHEDWIRREISRRLFYLIYMIELLASVWTHRPLSHREHDLKIFLPLDEASFELAVMDRPIPREYLLPLVPLHGGKSQASEFGFLIRVVAVYTRISDNLFARKHDQNEGGSSLHNDARIPPTVSDIVGDGEDALNTWERSLPSTMAFNEQNLQAHITTLTSGASVSGWCYCYMHAIAECCVLALQEAVELDRVYDRRQKSGETRQRALENLKVILISLGRQGRKSIMMGNILEAGAKHGMLSSRGHTDEQVATWYSDWESLWGISLDQLTSVEFRKNWVPDYPQDHLTYTTPSGRSGSKRSYPGGSFAVGTAVESDEATRVASPPASTDHLHRRQPDHRRHELPPLQTSSSSAGNHLPPPPFGRSIASKSSVDAPQHLQSPSDRFHPIPGGQQRSHSFPSTASSSPKPPLHDHHNSGRGGGGGGDNHRGGFDPSCQLPPPKFASASGEDSHIPRMKPEGLALPSIRAVGLLGDSIQEGSYARRGSRQQPTPSPTGSREDPSPT